MKITYLALIIVMLATFEIESIPTSSDSPNKILYSSIPLLCLVNRERAKAKVDPLALDE